MRHMENTCLRMLAYRPPRIAATMLIVAALTQIALPLTSLYLPSFLFAGTALGLLGFSIMIRAWWLFRQRETAICPTSVTTFLITDDVYALTRNPMYLGMTLLQIGIGLNLTNPWIAILAPVSMLLVYLIAIRPEEIYLSDKFGEPYIDYLTKTRRWI